MNDDVFDRLDKELSEANKNGDSTKQVEILRQLIALAQQKPNTHAEIEWLRQLGNTYQQMGDLQMSHTYRLTAAERVEKSGDCPVELQIWVEGDLGRSYIEAHDWKRAEAHTLTALNLVDSIDSERIRRVSRCIFHINLGLIYANTERLQESYKLAQTVIEVATELHDPYILALQHSNLALLRLSEMRLTQCQDHARRALVNAELCGNKEVRLRTQRILGESHRRAGLVIGGQRYANDAEKYLNQANELAETFGNTFLKIETELNMAELRETNRQIPEATEHYERALTYLEQVRSDLGYEEFQLTYFRSLQSSYERVIGFLLRYGHIVAAFQASERLRSRLLLALMGQKKQSNKKAWPPVEQERMRGILNRYGQEVLQQVYEDENDRGNSNKTVGIRSMGSNEALEDTTSLKQARKEFLNFFEAQKIYQAKWQKQQSPPVIDLNDAQHLIGPEDVLISYIVASTSIVIFVLTNQNYHFQQIHYSHDQIAADVAEVCKLMSNLQDQVTNPFVKISWDTHNAWPRTIDESMISLLQQLKKLFAILIAPVFTIASEKKHWIVLPNGPLHRVPWAALHSGRIYLIQQHTVSLLPSLSIGAVLERKNSASSGEALFFADPDLGNPLLELPAARKETIVASQIFTNGPLPFIGAQATKQNFLKHALSGSLLHLACHHYFDASVPLLSFLKLFGESGSDFLYAFEVAELQLSAELVTLSACQSGRSKIATGDEQYGIVRSFLVSGVQSVISTLWDIQDESAAVFFPNFYQRACKVNLSQALAETQRRMLKHQKYYLPNFWAPYILSGDWNNLLTIK